MGRAASDIPHGMRVLHGRFTRWRKSHTGRLPIPDPLWAAAAEMAREHGVFRTAKVLSLEYGKLKRLTMESPTSRRRTARLSTPPAAFVELLTPGLRARAAPEFTSRTSKSEIARRVRIVRTSVRRILAGDSSQE